MKARQLLPSPSLSFSSAAIPRAIDDSSSAQLGLAEQQHISLRERGTWIIRPAPYSNAFLRDLDKAYGWAKGDVGLTHVEEERLGDGVWAIGFVLVRADIPTDTRKYEWRRFVGEVRELFLVLKRASVEFEGPVAGEKARYWSIVAGERCALRIEVEDLVAETGSLGFALARNVLVLAAAFERELDVLRSAEEIVGFAVSRWLEGVLLRRIAEEKGMVNDGSRSTIGDEEERYKRAVGRNKERRDVVREMDDKEMLEEMRVVEKHGLRLGVAIRTKKDGQTQLVLEGQRSTLDAEYLVAYIELLVHIIDTAHQYGTSRLAEAIEDFQLLRPDSAIDRFSDMLDFLTQGGKQSSPTVKTALIAHLTAFDKSDSSSQTSSEQVPSSNPLRQVGDPLHKLRTYVESSYVASRRDTLQYVERYERAGGYRPTRYEKLRAMLEAGEARRAKAQEREV